jgi:hypothetical protein
MLRTSVALLLAAKGGCGLKIEAMKHDVQQITQANFDTVIAKFRDSQVSSLWFFKDTPEDNKFLDVYNEVAKDLKGMAKVCAISCDDWPVFCKNHDVTQTPSIKMFPTNPIPAYKFEGKMEAKAISARVASMIPNNALVLNKENIDTYLTTEPTKPKVILFSKKDKPPTILKALSSETVFRRTIKFGLIPEAEADLVKRFKVSKFPTVLMQRGGKAEEKETYKGDLTFGGLKEWINLYSESGMGDKVAGAGGKEEESLEDAKPWLVQKVPELTGKSANDICFKGEGLCVIYLKDGETSADEVNMLEGLSEKFTSQLSDRGAKMKWMWMNLKIETNFKDLFAPEQMPSAVVFNPHKRLRFTNLYHGEDGEIKGDVQGLTNLMDKVLGGDARFKMVPGQKLPSFAVRETSSKKKTEL